MFYKKKVQVLLANMILIRKQVFAKKRYVCFPNPYIVLTTLVSELLLVYAGIQHDIQHDSVCPLFDPRARKPSVGIKGPRFIHHTRKKNYNLQQKVSGEK